MKKRIKVGSVLLLVLMTATFAAAAQKPAVPHASPSAQLVISGLDAITAADAGGGYLSNRDILLVVLIVLAIIGLIAIL